MNNSNSILDVAGRTFTTVCPEWCTTTDRGLRHADDILSDSRHPATAHEASLGQFGDFTLYRIREDELVAGEVVSTEMVKLFGKFDEWEDVTAEFLRELAAMCLTAAEKIEKF